MIIVISFLLTGVLGIASYYFYRRYQRKQLEQPAPRIKAVRETRLTALNKQWDALPGIEPQKIQLDGIIKQFEAEDKMLHLRKHYTLRTIVLYGPPGVGKLSLARLLCEKLYLMSIVSAPTYRVLHFSDFDLQSIKKNIDETVESLRGDTLILSNASWLLGNDTNKDFGLGLVLGAAHQYAQDDKHDLVTIAIINKDAYGDMISNKEYPDWKQRFNIHAVEFTDFSEYALFDIAVKHMQNHNFEVKGRLVKKHLMELIRTILEKMNDQHVFQNGVVMKNLAKALIIKQSLLYSRQDDMPERLFISIEAIIEVEKKIDDLLIGIK